MSKKPEDLKDIVREAVEISAVAGRVIAGVGIRVASVQSDPKHCAMELLQCAEEFKMLSDACNRLAATICEIDAATPKIIKGSGLVSTNGRPL